MQNQLNPKLRVIVRIKGGAVQDVQSPQGVIVEVHDYDIEGTLAHLYTDEDGDQYMKGIWGQ